MLARLLRAMILVQVLLGAALGYALYAYGHWRLGAAVCVPLALPFVLMLLIDVYSALVSRAPEALGVWLASLAGEIWAGWLVFLLRQPWSFAAPQMRPAPGTGAGAQIPVVLVHGYMCNQRVWDDVCFALHAQGHAVYAVNLEPLFTSIDNYAPTIEAAVQALLAHTGQARVALVGHSMGGLAIRAWLRAHGSQRVARVLTLGTPHVGTQIPQHTPTPNGRQMAWGSDWLGQLGASESAQTRALFQIALTPQDNIVYPQRAQVLEGVTPTVFPGLGHVQLCTHPQVVAWVAQQLQGLAT